MASAYSESGIDSVWLSFITVSDEITVPVIFQLLILELAVDGLKMAAVNTPSLLSTPLSIVAGIVVGEYAVSSGWFNTESLYIWLW